MLDVDYSNVNARNRDVFDVLREELEYDDPHTVIFLDPPYALANNYYGIAKKQELFDHQRLRDMLAPLQHCRWMLTYNDTPYIHDLYQGVGHIGAVPITYVSYAKCNASRGRATKTQELLITNINQDTLPLDNNEDTLPIDNNEDQHHHHNNNDYREEKKNVAPTKIKRKSGTNVADEIPSYYEEYSHRPQSQRNYNLRQRSHQHYSDGES
jgi:hypothetical protein